MNYEKIEELTPKQRVFCEEYVIDYNGTRAAIKAGYSENAARSIASENLTKPNIKDYIQYLKDNVQEIAGLSQLMVVKELKKIAFANPSDLRKGWTELKEWEDLTEDQKATIAEVAHSEMSIGDDAVKKIIKVKQFDKLKALQQLCKMFGWDEKKEEEGESRNVKSVYIEFGEQEDVLPEYEDDIEDVDLEEQE